MRLRAETLPGAALSATLALLLAIASGLAVASIYYAQPLLDRIADEFGLGRAAAGIVFTVTQVGYGLGLLLVVPLGDLLERRRLVLGQLLLSVLALAGVALAPNGAVLLVAVAAVGVLAVVAQILVASASVLSHPSERGRAVGMVTTGIVIGIVLARVVAGALSDLLGWRAVYLLAAFATLLVAVLLYGTLPSEPRVRARLSYRRLIGSLLGLFVEEPLLRVRAVLALLIFAAITMLVTPLALSLSAPPQSLSHTQIGLFGLSGLAGALGATWAGRLADRGHAQAVTLLGLGCMLIAWLPSALLSVSVWGLIAGAIAIDFGLQSVHVANQSLIYRLRPEAQSRLAAGYMIFYAAGAAAGAIASTLVFDHAGWFGVCAAGAALSAFALAFWALTQERAPAPQFPDPQPLERSSDVQ